MRRVIAILLVVLAVALVFVAGFTVYLVQQQGTGTTSVNGTPNSTATSAAITIYNPTGMLHVQGSQIIDASGHQVILRGAQIESPFNNMKPWENGKDPTKTLNSTTFNAMVHDWHMNVLRLPTSNWIYAKYTADYMNKLDQVVQQANAAGLYVVLDLHDDAKSGSPYGKNANLPKTEDVTYWKAIATHFKDNPMVFYDVANEPQYPSWDVWLHGGTTIGGATVVGMQDLVNAIRSVGAKQIIVLEPGSAGHEAGSNAESGGWTTFPAADTIKNPNVIYSLHVYSNIAQNPQQQDTKWGPILNHYPLFYGEWAFLPNAMGGGGSNGSAKCSGVAHDQASQVVNNFLNYMASRNASWVAWSFEPHYLVTDYNSYAPTTLNTNWTCGDQTTTKVGMGDIVKQYLQAHPAS